MDQDEKIADLQRQIAALKNALPRDAEQRAADERMVAEHRDRMHQMAEQRMARAGNFSREDLAAMEAAAPRSVCQDIAARGGVRPPSADGTTGTISSVHRSPGVYSNTVAGGPRLRLVRSPAITLTGSWMRRTPRIALS